MAHDYNSDGLFQGVISGMFNSIGTGLLDKQDKDREQAEADKKTRISILQHAIDGGKLDDAGEQSAFKQLLEINNPKGSGNKKDVGALHQSITAALGPIQAIRKVLKAGQGNSSLPAAATRNASASGPQLTEAPIRMKTAAERQAEEDTATQHKADIENQSKLDYAQKEIAAKSEEEQAAIQRDFEIFKKYYKKDPDPDQIERILEKHGIINPNKAKLAPTRTGEVLGSDVDEETRKKFGLDPGKRYARFEDRETSEESYKVISAKPNASDQKMNDEMAEVRAAHPDISDDDAKRQVLLARGQKRRLQILNLQESVSGKQITNQVKSDLQAGKVTPATSRLVLSSTLQTAKTYNADPTSEFFMKGVDAIQKSLLAEAGFDYTELLKASGGGAGTSKTKENPDPLGILTKP